MIQLLFFTGRYYNKSDHGNHVSPILLLLKLEDLVYQQKMPYLYIIQPKD